MIIALLYELPGVAIRVSAIPGSEHPHRRASSGRSRPAITSPLLTLPRTCVSPTLSAQTATGAVRRWRRHGGEDCLADPERFGATGLRRAERDALI